MTKHMKALLLLLIGAYGAMAQSQISSYGNLNYIKLPNGMNWVITRQSVGAQTSLMLYVRTGTIYENDTAPGISNIIQHVVTSKINKGIQSGNRGLAPGSVSFVGKTLPEYTTYEFIFQGKDLYALLGLIRDSVFLSEISITEIRKASDKVKAAYIQRGVTPSEILETKLKKAIFRNDYHKVDIIGDTAKFVNITAERANRYKTKYYVPENTQFAMNGPEEKDFSHNLEQIFKPVIRSEYNPEMIIKFAGFKPMIYTSHFIVADQSSDPEFHICWQFPGATSNERESYYAHLITTMLNDKNNYIQVKAARMGCRGFEARYEANNFSGVLRVILKPSRENLKATYDFVVQELENLEKTMLNEVMLNSGKLNFKRQYDYIAKSPLHPQMVVKYWPYNDETYYQALIDSVMNLTGDGMKRFVVEMIKERPHVSGLRISEDLRKELKVDSVFTDCNEKTADVVFRYRQNICELEGEENRNNLNVLLQWLKANPDVNVQINGFADEGEYTRFRDDSILTYIDSMPTFRKMNPDILKKKNFRPEMLRAMKIIKYLNDQGIESERLTGTSMTYTSANRTEAAENMKCTVSIKKLRKNMSLYEFHYGKRKDE